MNKITNTMRSKKYILGIVIGLISFFSVSCIKDDDSTIVLPLPYATIPDIMIPPFMVDSLSHYMDIYDGVTPPCIEGCYIANPVQLVYASDDYFNDNFFDIHMSYSSQSCRRWISYMEHQNSATLGTDSALVMGHDDKFTVACTASMEDNIQQWTCKLALVASGRKAQGGIADFQYAVVMLEKNDPNHVLLNIHDFRVYHDKDAFAKDTVWNYNVESRNSNGVDVTCGKRARGGAQ